MSPLWEGGAPENRLQEWGRRFTPQPRPTKSQGSAGAGPRERPTLYSHCRVVEENHGWSLWWSTTNHCQWRLTRASLSLVSHATYKRLWPSRKLKESRVKVRTYSGDPIVVLRYLEVKMQYQDQDARLTLTVVEGEVQVFLEETGYSTYAWIGIDSIVSAQAVWREC